MTISEFEKWLKERTLLAVMPEDGAVSVADVRALYQTFRGVLCDCCEEIALYKNSEGRFCEEHKRGIF